MKCNNRHCHKIANDYCGLIMTKPSHPLSFYFCPECYKDVYHIIRLFVGEERPDAAKAETVLASA